MKDRLAKYPGRYTAIVDTEKIEKGVPFNIEIARDDEPTVEGTPYNKESVLPDSVAEAICPNVEDPTPADAFMALHTKKAPAGYGLGEKVSPATAWKFAGSNGFSRSSNDSPDGKLWWGITSTKDSGIGTHIAFSNANNILTEAKRYYTTNSYDVMTGTWEYVNPPMLEGVQYRTTERFNGKPVYARYLNCGALPNATSKQIFVANNISNIVRVEGYLNNTAGYLLQTPISNVSALGVYLYNHSELRLTTTSDYSTWDAYVAVYYTLEE